MWNVLMRSMSTNIRAVAHRVLSSVSEKSLNLKSARDNFCASGIGSF